MDDEIKEKFNTTEQKFSLYEKRFDDLKWYFGGAATFFTIWFAVLTIVLNVNINGEKESLRDFQQRLREDLGKSEALPDIELFGMNHKSLMAQEIKAKYWVDTNGYARVQFDHIMKNTGTGTTGPMSIKIYSNDPLQLFDESSDEPDYQYETDFDPKELNPDELPGGMSIQWEHSFSLATNLAAGKYPVLLKIYYGNGKVSQSTFSLIISNVVPR